MHHEYLYGSLDCEDMRTISTFQETVHVLSGLMNDGLVVVHLPCIH